MNWNEHIKSIVNESKLYVRFCVPFSSCFFYGCCCSHVYLARTHLNMKTVELGDRDGVKKRDNCMYMTNDVRENEIEMITRWISNKTVTPNNFVARYIWMDFIMTETVLLFSSLSHQHKRYVTPGCVTLSLSHSIAYKQFPLGNL